MADGEEMNGTPMAPVNAALVAQFEKLLASAKKGEIVTGGFILITPGGEIFTPVVGPQPIYVIAGAEILKEKLLQHLLKPSTIIRPAT